jgi:hypothetical protein
MGGLALFAALTVLAVLAPAGAVAATGSISGTVTDASTTGGIEGISVCAYPLEFKEVPVKCDLTAVDGTYAIEDLEPAEYEVQFWPGELDYLTQYYDGKSSRSEADLVPVATGAVTGIDAALQKSGAIEGKVTATFGGAAVPGVEVCAWKLDVDESEEGLLRCTETAPEGTYFLPGLRSGEYKVEFFAVETDQEFAFQFYDRKSFWSEADSVAVTLGATVTGIDAELHPGAGISGTVYSAASGALLRQIIVCPLDAAHAELLFWSCTETNSAGRYRIHGLPAGSYKVVFSPEFKEFFGEALFEWENDGYPTQFYNGKPTLAAADTLSLPVGGGLSGVDARLGPPAAPAAPVVSPPVVEKKHRVHRQPCKRGTKRKKVHGKVRCVRIRRHNHRHRHGHKHRLDRLESRSPELLRLFSR